MSIQDQSNTVVVNEDLAWYNGYQAQAKEVVILHRDEDSNPETNGMLQRR